jgi:hypothetical protein
MQSRPTGYNVESPSRRSPFLEGAIAEFAVSGNLTFTGKNEGREALLNYRRRRWKKYILFGRRHSYSCRQKSAAPSTNVPAAIRQSAGKATSAETGRYSAGSWCPDSPTPNGAAASKIRHSV